jgi:hypothetical protein
MTLKAITEKTPVTLPIIAIGGLIGLAVSATLAWSALAARADAAIVATRQVDERVQRLEAANIKFAEMARDLDWIKHTMKRERGYVEP